MEADMAHLTLQLGAAVIKRHCHVKFERIVRAQSR
jgi:hypothetical protein